MAESAKEQQGPFLGDILVLDFTEGQWGFCAKLLADLGAKVIKVEGPGSDRTRKVETSGSDSNGHPVRVSPVFLYHNTNKLGLSLDPASPEDGAALRALIGKADVLIENSKTSTGNTFPLDPKWVQLINPAVIHLSVSAFGLTGPRAAFRSCDAVLSAFGGQMAVVGSPSGPPRPLAGGQSAYSSSLFGAVAVLLSLRERRLTGNGRFIDLSAQEAVASTLDHVMVDFFRDGTVSRRQGDVYGDGSSAILECADGHVLIDVQANWETIVELMAAEGKDRAPSGDRWCDRSYRAAHLRELLASVQAWTKDHTKAGLFDLGQTMRFPWAPVSTLKEVLESPQLFARGFFIPLEGVRVGNMAVSVPGLPFRFSSFQPPSPKAAPLIGEHSRQILDGVDCFPSEMETGPAEGPGKATSPAPRPVLEGVRVLDFTRMLAGPYATRILADFGAEVIKVEPISAFERDDPYRDAWNRNKRSIALDLNRPEACRIVSMLVATSDVVVENFSPRVMANWNLSYENLREMKANLVMASISAMGQTGPWKDYVGFAPTFHVLSGLAHETSRGLEDPLCPGHAYGDTIIGLYAALAILAALKRRDVSGQGEYIDLSGYECLCTLLGPALIGAALTGREDCGDQDYIGEGMEYIGCHPCLGADRWCVIALRGEDDRKALAGAAGLPDLLDDRFLAVERRKAHRSELGSLITSWTLNHTPEKVVEILQGAGLAAGVVQDARDLSRDPQLVFRSFFVSSADRSALFLGGLERKEWRKASFPGQDRDYVLGELLGFPLTDILGYAEKGIVG